MNNSTLKKEYKPPVKLSAALRFRHSVFAGYQIDSSLRVVSHLWEDRNHG